MKSKQDILSAINEVVELKRQDSIWNHLITIIRFDLETYSGEVTTEEFKIWNYSYWVGIFYPVIHGYFETSNGIQKLKLKSKLNPIGFAFAFLIVSGFGYGILLSMINQQDTSLEFLLRRIIFGLIIFSIPPTALYLIYNSQKKKEIEKIKNVCQQRL